MSYQPPTLTDLWQIAQVLWVMSSLYGPCREVRVDDVDEQTVEQLPGQRSIFDAIDEVAT